MKNPKIWLITGVSGGLGLALMKEVLKLGDIVIGSIRNPNQQDQIRSLHPENAHPLVLDINDHEAVKNAISLLIQKFGRIDVLVNNAGFGLFGAIEECSLDEVRMQMETNFFSNLFLTQNVLPHMRKHKSGCIVQLSSIAGIRSAAGLGIYNASKYALEGYSEALYHECKPLNINVILVEPGPFRTEFAGTSARVAEKEIEDYKETAGAFKQLMHERNGTQIGDPVKGSQKIIKAVNHPTPPLRLPLGKIALDGIRAKMEWINSETTAWESDIIDTDFDQ